MAIDELQQTELSHVQKTYLTQAFVCMDLMTLTIAQALDIGKATVGKKLVPRRTTVQLPELLQHCHIVIQGCARRVPIRSHLSEDVCPTVITDKEWLWQMVRITNVKRCLGAIVELTHRLFRIFVLCVLRVSADHELSDQRLQIY